MDQASIESLDVEEEARFTDGQSMLVRDHAGKKASFAVSDLMQFELVKATLTDESECAQLVEFPLAVDDLDVFTILTRHAQPDATTPWPMCEDLSDATLQCALRMANCWQPPQAVLDRLYAVAAHAMECMFRYARGVSNSADEESKGHINPTILIQALGLTRSDGNEVIPDLIECTTTTTTTTSEQGKAAMHFTGRDAILFRGISERDAFLEARATDKLKSQLSASCIRKLGKQTSWSIGEMRKLMTKTYTGYDPYSYLRTHCSVLDAKDQEALRVAIEMFFERQRVFLAIVLHRSLRQSRDTLTQILMRVTCTHTILHMAVFVMRAFLCGFLLTGSFVAYRHEITQEPLRTLVLRQLRVTSGGSNCAASSICAFQSCDEEYQTLLFAPEHRIQLAHALHVPDRSRNKFMNAASLKDYLDDSCWLRTHTRQEKEEDKDSISDASSSSSSSPPPPAFQPDERSHDDIAAALRKKHEEQEAVRMREKLRIKRQQQQQQHSSASKSASASSSRKR
jgi:hypothetical protein